MTRVHRFVKLHPLPGTPDVFTLRPEICRGRNSTGDGYIYVEQIGPGGLDCHAFTGILEEKHKFKFASFLDALSSRGLHIGEKIVGIVDIPRDLRDHFATSLSPPDAVKVRTTQIKNCGSGWVEQEIEVKSETSITSRLEVQDTFVVGEEVGERTFFGGKVGVKVLGLFKAETEITKSWQQDTFSQRESHSEKVFMQDETSSIKHTTTIQVGNHSCVNISATSAIFKNNPWHVNLAVELVLGQEIKVLRNAAKNNETFIGVDEEDDALVVTVIQSDATIFSQATNATVFLDLMKFSGFNYTFDEKTRTLRYLKPAKLQVTSLVSTNTAIQQVKECKCGI
ncbi:uncharacterized protein LOC110856400 [Folsomia candida]|uniref:Uncharacterized protein n=1 Tax=Folsomia candida TaxID=158441 RepID=A0A226DN61_FOLCA|nr:uncharacterized protein LOC110856400 [Folsomia candida]OXA46663.1 hypothetical protein Fcan01_18835 [Folsomia candida]